MSAFEIRAWSPDEPATPAAFTPWPEDSALSASAAEARREWALRANPAGTRLFLAEEGARVLACCAALPVRTRVLGEPRMFTQLLGPLPASGEEHEALLASARALHGAHARADGDLVFYGWEPEDEAGLAKQHLGYELLSVPALLGRAPGSGPETPPEDVHEGADFDAAFDELYACCATHWNASAIRDAAFLRWRFASNPFQRYRVFSLRSGSVVRGYAVYRSASDVRPGLGFLMDWLVLPGDEEASEKLLAAVVAAARGDGVGMLAGVFPEWSPWSLWFQERGFLHRPGRHACQVRGSVGRFDMLWLREAWWNTLADVLTL